MTEIENFTYIDENIISKIKIQNEQYTTTHLEYFNKNRDVLLKDLELSLISALEDQIYYKIYQLDFWNNLNLLIQNKGQVYLSEKEITALKKSFSEYTYSFKNDNIKYFCFKASTSFSLEISFNYSLKNQIIYIDINNQHSLVNNSTERKYILGVAQKNKEEWFLENKESLFPNINKNHTINKQNLQILFKEFSNILTQEIIENENICNIILNENMYDKETLNINYFKNRLIFHHAKVTQMFLKTDYNFAFNLNNSLLFYHFPEIFLTIFLEDFKRKNIVYYEVDKEFNIVTLKLINFFKKDDHNFYITIKGQNLEGFLEFYKNDNLIKKFSLCSNPKKMIDAIDQYIKKDFLKVINQEPLDEKKYHKEIENNYLEPFYNIIPFEKEKVNIQYNTINQLTYEQIFFGSYYFKLFYNDTIFYENIFKKSDINKYKESIFSAWEKTYLISKTQNNLRDEETKKRL